MQQNTVTVKYNFNEIEYSLIDGCVELRLFDTVNEVSTTVSIDKRRLLELFGEEFIYRRGKREYEISLHEWYPEYMNPSKAWQIFEAVSIDELTFNTTE